MCAHVCVCEGHVTLVVYTFDTYCTPSPLFSPPLSHPFLLHNTLFPFSFPPLIPTPAPTPTQTTQFFFFSLSQQPLPPPPQQKRHGTAPGAPCPHRRLAPACCLHPDYPGARPRGSRGADVDQQSTCRCCGAVEGPAGVATGPRVGAATAARDGTGGGWE